MSLTERIQEIKKGVNFYKDQLLLDYVRNKVLQYDVAGNVTETRKLCDRFVEEYCNEHYTDVPDKNLYDYVYNLLFGLGPIEKHLKNPDVTDIWVMGTNIIYMENGEKKEDTESFMSNEDVIRVIEKIAGQTYPPQVINAQIPSVDAELYDGSRALLIVPPESLVPVITIRKHTSNAKSLEELRGGYINLTDDMIEYFKNIVKERKNILAVGQTGSGKTTFLNGLTFYIQPKHVVALLEDTREMSIPLKYVYSFKIRKGTEDTKPITWTNILNDCLRANPNRIIIAEIRTPEAAYEFLDTLNSGHKGSMTTIHASSTVLALQKLEMKIKEYKNMDDRSLRTLISNTIDVIVYLDVLENEEGDNIGRVIKEIVEVKGLNSDNTYDLDYVYKYEESR